MLCPTLSATAAMVLAASFRGYFVPQSALIALAPWAKVVPQSPSPTLHFEVTWDEQTVLLGRSELRSTSSLGVSAPKNVVEDINPHEFKVYRKHRSGNPHAMQKLAGCCRL